MLREGGSKDQTLEERLTESKDRLLEELDKWAAECLPSKPTSDEAYSFTFDEIRFEFKVGFTAPRNMIPPIAITGPGPSPESLMSDDAVRAGALEWVNGVRADYGLEPYKEIPAGYRYSTTNCALANMTKGLSDGSCSMPPSSGIRGPGVTGGEGGLRFSRDGEIKLIAPPPVVDEFIRRFDRGAFPDLNLGSIS